MVSRAATMYSPGVYHSSFPLVSVRWEFSEPVPTATNPPGFLMGLLHGFTALFALLGEPFTNYRMYAFPNSGGFYDLGFVIGASAAFGGSGAAGR